MRVTADETDRLNALRNRIDVKRQNTRSDLEVAERADRVFMGLRLLSFGTFFGFFGFAAITQSEAVAMGIIPSLAAFFVVLKVHQPRRAKLRELRMRRGILKAKAERIAVATRTRPHHAARDTVRKLMSPHRLAGARPESATLSELGILDEARGVLGLVDTAQTALGSWNIEDRLSGVLRDPAIISADQEACRCLLQSPDFRLALAEVYSRSARWDEQAAATFLNGPLPARELAPRMASVLPFTIGTIALGVLSVEMHSLLLAVAATLWAGIGNILHLKGLNATADIRNGTAECVGYLNLISDVRLALRNARLESAVIGDIEQQLDSLEASPPHSTDQARRLLGRLGIYRAGLFYVFFNFLTLYDLYFTRPLIDYWHNARDGLVMALTEASRLEGLCALANTAEEQVGYSFPDIITAEDPCLELADARHPVLDANEAVAMSIELNHGSRTYVVTGANMAGKSTLIRSLGAACVLGSAGGPVAARTARMTPLLLASDINVTDSLRDGESTFGAEAKRVAAISATVQETPHTLVLLDEVFRGTNTHEKVAAGRAFVKWLSLQGSLTVAATHDHELTTLAEEPESAIKNVHFNAECENGQLIFDYLLRTGPAPGTNALAVLADAGLPMEIVDDAVAQLPSAQQIRKNQ